MKLRGVQVPPTVSLEELQKLSAAGANAVRFQIACYPSATKDEWSTQVLEHSQILKRYAQAFPEITFIAQLMRPPPSGADLDLIWAAHKDMHNILDEHIKYFGVLNEPPFKREVTRKIMVSVGQEISENTNIAILTYPRSDPPHFAVRDGKESLVEAPYGIHHAWYEVHMYLPMRITHQGVPTYPQYPVGAKYPDDARGLNKEKLKRLLQPVKKFQQVNRRQIILSEFGCSIETEAESRYRYLSDVIDIAEEWNWHWIYHAYSVTESPHWQVDERIWQLFKDKWKGNK